MPLSTPEINEVLQSYFNKVMVVTVPRFTARHEKVKQRLAGLSFEFFYGADKLTLSEEFIAAQYRYDRSKTLSPGFYFKPMNKGEIACSLSHRMLYQTMLDQQWEKVLVLEDDAVPVPEQLAKLDIILRELPADWDLVYLGYLKNERPAASAHWKQRWYSLLARLGLSKIPLGMVKRLLPKSYSQHWWKAGFHDCTHAYALSLAGAKKLLATQTPVQYRADNLLSAAVLKGELNAFAVKDFIFNQEVFTDHTDQSQIREKWANQ